MLWLTINTLILIIVNIKYLECATFSGKSYIFVYLKFCSLYTKSRKYKIWKNQPTASTLSKSQFHNIFSYGQNHSTQNEAYKQNFMIILGTFGQLCVFFVFWRQWGWCVCKEMQDTMTPAILSIDWIVDVVVLFIAC